MASELRSKRAGLGVSVSIGERVMMEGREGEFVVVDVDHANGRIELLQLKPARIESGPASSVRAKSEPEPHMVASEPDN
jgi:hypothetical protein